VVRVDLLAPVPGDLEVAARALQEGKLVAFPTETVYGLGAHALDPKAVRSIFAAKGRPVDNPLIVHVADAGDLALVTDDVPPLARTLAARWWPGPLTLVLTAAAHVPRETTGGLETVAVRVPDHPVARALIDLAGIPVAAPSANRSGRPSPTTAEHVVTDLGSLVDIVVDGGPCEVGVESTVVDVRHERPVVLRDGAVSREQLGAAGGAADLRGSPGTRYRHYQPACAVEISPAGEGVRRARQLAERGVRVGLVAACDEPPPSVRLVARCEDAPELARELYGALRRAEEEGLEVVVVDEVEERGIGRAVMDRLRRAAGEPSDPQDR
jgi:L-threonylcarbamoyladenylate synthase